MKLCIVTHSVIKGDGQGRVNYEVAWEAVRRGHYVTLLASRVAPELQKSSLVNWIYIPVQKWPTEFIRNMIFSWRSTNWLRKHRCELDLVKVNGAITKAPGDVNAVHFVHSSWLQFSYKNSTRSPINLWHLRPNLRSVYQWFYTVLNSHWEKKAFCQAKVVVAVSKQVGQELVEIGVSKESIRVLVNGVDLQEFFPGSAERQKLGLPEGVSLALFVGDIRTPRKNLDTVLHALAQVPNLHLAVVGATEGSLFPQLSLQLGLGARVHFLGYRHDIAKIMQAADLFVFPSRYEPFGLVILEAMATGIPVITAKSTGAADLVTPESGIVLPDADDTKALAQALNTLASDRHLRSQMGQAARAIAERYSWNKMAQNYVNLFEELSQ